MRLSRSFYCPVALLCISFVSSINAHAHGSGCNTTIFGYINHTTTAVVDGSTPPDLMASIFKNDKLKVKAPLNMIHYAPGLKTSPDWTTRNSSMFKGLLDDAGLGCVKPGAPNVGKCGMYHVIEYKGCKFPKFTGLVYGGLDLDRKYTNSAGVFKGCEKNVVKSRYVCYRKASASAAPAKIDCSQCSTGSGCTPTIFGFINQTTTAVVDGSTPPDLMATIFSNPKLSVKAPLNMIHYAPGIKSSADWTARNSVPFVGLMDTATNQGCVKPGAPNIGKCGKYHVIEYKPSCPVQKFSGLVYGGLDLDRKYTTSSGIFKGCEDKVVSHRYVCYRKACKACPPMKVECSECKDTKLKKNSACAESVFGYIDPDNTVVVDGSTPAPLMSKMFKNDKIKAGKDGKLYMIHYMPGIKSSPDWKTRSTGPFKGLANLKDGCVAPGAPNPGKCGKYQVMVYDGTCKFPKPSGLTLGGLDVGSKYIDSKGYVKGCEKKVTKQYVVCYLSPTGKDGKLTGKPPAKVDCYSKCGGSGLQKTEIVGKLSFSKATKLTKEITAAVQSTIAAEVGVDPDQVKVEASKRRALVVKYTITVPTEQAAKAESKMKAATKDAAALTSLTTKIQAKVTAKGGGDIGKATAVGTITSTKKPMPSVSSATRTGTFAAGAMVLAAMASALVA